YLAMENGRAYLRFEEKRAPNYRPPSFKERGSYSPQLQLICQNACCSLVYVLRGQRHAPQLQSSAKRRKDFLFSSQRPTRSSFSFGVRCRLVPSEFPRWHRIPIFPKSPPGLSGLKFQPLKGGVLRRIAFEPPSKAGLHNLVIQNAAIRQN